METLHHALQVALLDALSDMVPAGVRHRYLDHTVLADVAFAVLHDAGDHHYLSTGCLHGNHAYCKGIFTGDGQTKTPARCKFCSAACECPCHTATTTTTDPVSGV